MDPPSSNARGKKPGPQSPRTAPPAGAPPDDTPSVPADAERSRSPAPLTQAPPDEAAPDQDTLLSHPRRAKPAKTGGPAIPGRAPLTQRTLAGRLELLELLGGGSMGQVYRARHHGLDKEVAIKVLLERDGDQDMRARRFKIEARAASRLDHPNSVRILDFGEDDGLLYLAMEYLPGEDLQDTLRREGRLGTYRTCWIMAQVGSALAAAHDAGVIHRDLKPGNIMLVARPGEDGVVQDFVKVCDFGLAKVLEPKDTKEAEASGPVTRRGAVFGTPAYMSPEQAQGLPLDPRSDIYACGAVMYRMLTGTPPFRGTSATEVLLKHIQTPRPRLHTVGVDVDARVEAIVDRCMAKQPADRFASARHLRDALREILHEEGLEIPGFGGPLRPLRSAVWSPPRSVPVIDTENEPASAQDRANTRLLATVPEGSPADETARLMATYPPADLTIEHSGEVGPQPAPAMRWAWIPGALALVLAGALAVYLMFGPQ